MTNPATAEAPSVGMSCLLIVEADKCYSRKDDVESDTRSQRRWHLKSGCTLPLIPSSPGFGVVGC